MLKKIVIAPDSFKGTMSSHDICNIVERGIRGVFPHMEIIKLPIADGGEGTVDSFIQGAGGEKIKVIVKGPHFDEIDSFYGMLPDSETAVIEIAAACGLPLTKGNNNPMITTSYGAGQLISHALDRGLRKFIIGLGGSGTNDGGIGLAAALGVKFTNSSGKEVPLNGKGLGEIEHIDLSRLDRRIKDCKFLAACDVDNPLHGINGAAHVFAPQKGAGPEMVEVLDKNLIHYGHMIKKYLSKDVAPIKGAGAAGGLGAGLMAFFDAELKSGINLILETVDFGNIIKDCSLIITGEGKIDGQSLRGKVVLGVASYAQKEKIPVIAIVGDIGDDMEEVYKRGVTSVFSINRLAIPFEEARLRSRDDLEKTVDGIMRFAKIFNSTGRGQ